MGTEAVGKLHLIYEHKQVSERFAKREFVLELLDNPKYPQLVLFQLTGDRCAQLEGMNVGDTVRIDYSLRGREWKSPSGEVKFFNSLDVWKLEPARAGERAGNGRGDYNDDRGGGGGGGGGGYQSRGNDRNYGGGGGGGARGGGGGGRSAPPRDDAPPPAYEPRPSDSGGSSDLDDLPF